MFARRFSMMQILETTELCDEINGLMDLELAAEHRCRTTAAHVESPGLKARLLLCAAGHEVDADRLRHLVLDYDGIPHAGETTAILADPVHLFPQVDGGDDRQLLDACLQEEDAEIERFEGFLQDTHWPELAREVVWDCLGRVRSRRRVLSDWRGGVALG
jgi:hypothetical protein